MSKASLLGLLVVVAALGLPGCSHDEVKGDKSEKHKKTPIAEADVPKPVLATMTKTYPTAKTIAWVQKGDGYSVKAQDAGRWLDVSFLGDGSMKEGAEEVSVDAAPEPVKKAFAASPYAKMPFVDGVKKVVPGKDDETLFKFVVKDGEKGRVAVYDKTGKLLKEKEMPAEKLAKWQKEHTVAK